MRGVCIFLSLYCVRFQNGYGHIVFLFQSPLQIFARLAGNKVNIIARRAIVYREIKWYIIARSAIVFRYEMLQNKNKKVFNLFITNEFFSHYFVPSALFRHFYKP